METTNIPYADPGRASFEQIGDWSQNFLLGGAYPAMEPAFSFDLPNNCNYPQFAVLGLDSNKKLQWATEGYSPGVRASAVATFTGVGTADETITIGDRVYTLKAAVTAANHVLIGASAAATAANLVAAVNGGAGEGTVYGTGTVPHQNVSARSNGAGVVGLVAQDEGTAGNALASTETSTALSFGGATFAGGLDSAGIKAAFVLAHAASLGASGSAKGQCWYTGNYNPAALVWHSSFQTDAQKADAFRGAPTPTNILITKRL